MPANASNKILIKQYAILIWSRVFLDGQLLQCIHGFGQQKASRASQRAGVAIRTQRKRFAVEDFIFLSHQHQTPELPRRVIHGKLVWTACRTRAALNTGPYHFLNPGQRLHNRNVWVNFLYICCSLHRNLLFAQLENPMLYAPCAMR